MGRGRVRAGDALEDPDVALAEFGVERDEGGGAAGVVDAPPRRWSASARAVSAARERSEESTGSRIAPSAPDTAAAPRARACERPVSSRGASAWPWITPAAFHDVWP